MFLSRSSGATVRACVLAAFSAMTLGALGVPDAQAQDALTNPPPVYSDVDPQNVDLGTGAFTLSVSEVVIGKPGSGGLSYGRSFIGLGWRDSLMGGIDATGNVYTVSLGGASESFTLANGIFTNAGGGPSTLTLDSFGQIFTYTMADGTVASFQNSVCCNVGLQSYSGTTSTMGRANQARIVTMTFPSGEIRTWNYVYATFKDADGSNKPKPFGRLQSVSSNFGYQIRYIYLANNTTLIDQLRNWVSVTGVVGFNMAEEVCDPAAQQCTAAETRAKWPKVTYGGSGTYRTATDNLGRVTRYTYTSGNMTGIRWSKNADDDSARSNNPTRSDDIVIGYDSSSRVTSVNNGVGTWNYSYADSGSVRTTTVTDPEGRQRIVTSDLTTGLMKSDTRVVSPGLSLTTTIGYDTLNRTQRITRPQGDYTRYSYNVRGDVTQTQVVSTDGKTSSSTYASYEDNDLVTCSHPARCNKPLTTKDAANQVTTYAYDPTHGGVTQVTAPTGANGLTPTTVYTYGQYSAVYNNGSGQISGPAIYRLTGTSTCATASACTGSSDGAISTVDYGNTSQPNNLLPVSVMRRAGDSSVSATTSYTYDTIGNTLSVTQPGSGTTYMTYDAIRRVVGTVGAPVSGTGGYRAVSTTYDDRRNLVTTVKQGTVANATESNVAGAIAMRQQVVTSYDAAGRKTQDTLTGSDGTQVVTNYDYDKANYPKSTTRPMGGQVDDRVTSVVYDGAGRALTQSANGQLVAQTSYTDDGLTHTLMDGKNNTTSYDYDTLNRPKTVTYPSVNGAASTEGYTYYDTTCDTTCDTTNPTTGRVKTRTLRDTQQLTYSYDNLGLVTGRAGGGVDHGFTYDNLGRVKDAKSSTGPTVSHTYDALGHLTSQTTGTRTVGSRFDAAGRLVNLVWPDNFTATYCYDTTGALTSIWAGWGPGTSCTNADGISSVSDGNASRLVTYTYDESGRRTATTRANGVTTSYGFDGASRLTSQKFTGSTADLSLTFSYNQAGQILGKSASVATYDAPVPETGTVNQPVNALNQATASGGSAISYDGRGNITAAGSTTIGYDVDNHLTSMAAATLSYDGLGRLYQVSQSSTTRFLYFGDRLVAEYDGSSPGVMQRRYIPGPGVDETVVYYVGAGTGDRRWLIPDERGSIIAEANDGGTVLSINTYDEYGRPSAKNSGRFQYTGQVWLAEIQAYYYKARIYIPSLGKFAQADPSGYSAGMNLYAYAGGDPVNNTDPTGLAQCQDNKPCKTGREIDIEDAPQGGGGFGDGLKSPTIWGPAPGWTSLSDFGNWTGGNGAWSGVLSAPDLNGGLAPASPQSTQEITITGRRPQPPIYDPPIINVGDDITEFIVVAVAPEYRGFKLLFNRGRSLYNWLADDVFQPSACFAAGTLVATDRGLRAIDKIKPGDTVLSRDEKTGRTAYQRVTAVKVPTLDELYSVDLEVAAGQKTEHRASFKATASHPWRTADGQWVATSQLRPGMQLTKADGASARVEGVHDTGHKAPTYNLTVEGYHTYFVGKDRLWVHNACTKAESPIWQGLRNWRGKTRTDGSRYYEWDYTHDNIEVYNNRGTHIGVMDPVSGEMIGDPVIGRTINVR
ncbi:polymorphic toxin-type HINT domain-containing protein [Nitrospirillum viridazoti]|uniref:Intein/RHS repeat-associated protein n=1 Tax=Nitrospirillum amazonense TaxID=28077 RepID=A0A560HQV9_9PROT|nr:polymorphic toxin-type HINT domain-containing protein [Nitrospirillum amazonense]TWB48962.1 intein/RHS repeat-associated protein [Nitrospirillum amazonense]